MYSAFEKNASLALVTSAALALWILSTDSFLLAAQPTHAYGLVAFVVLDVVFATLILARRKLAFPGALVFGVIQFLAMASDPLTGPQIGMTVEVFAKYLFSNWAFDALLIAQIAVVLMSWRGYVARKSEIARMAPA